MNSPLNLINQCLRTGQPLPARIKLFKFPAGTFAEVPPAAPAAPRGDDGA